MAEDDKAARLARIKAAGLTPQDIVEVVRELAPELRAPAGVGAPAGLGCPGDLSSEVYGYLAAGSPRLALAKALGVPLAPYLINVRATFSSTSETDVPEVGSDVKIVQDTECDAFLVRIVNQSQVANQSIFQPQSDWYYTFQSGIEATLDVQGAPRYAVAPRFTPLASLLDAFNGDSKWPRKWILTYQQQLLMSFHATVVLPFAPIEVVCTFRGWVPVGEAFVEMTNREALDKLADMGFTIPDALRARTLTGLLGR
jgi:hypothetical protein